MAGAPIACSINSGTAPEGLSDGCRGAPLTPGAKLPIPGDESIMRQKAHGTTETGVMQDLRWGVDVRLADRICWCVLCTCPCRAPRPSSGLSLRAREVGKEAPGRLPWYGTHPPLSFIFTPATTGTTQRCVHSVPWNSSGADTSCAGSYPQHAGYWETTNFLKEVDRTKETVYYDPVTGRPLFIAPRGRTFAEFEKESRSHGWPSFRDEEVVWDDVRVLPDGEAVSTAGTHLGHNLPDRKGNRYCINLVSIAGKPK
jgi:peptide methionine sulfoxide reductase MsrB